MDSSTGLDVKFVFDTTVLLACREPPAGKWMVSPEVAAEIQPGGVTGRFTENLYARGLQIFAPSVQSMGLVSQAGSAAGNLGRLSKADLSILALALDHQGATLISDDHTVLDLAKRLAIPSQPWQTKGIRGTKNFRPRCTGCGRWFDVPTLECLICGSPVVLKPDSG